MGCDGTLSRSVSCIVGVGPSALGAGQQSLVQTLPRRRVRQNDLLPLPLPPPSKFALLVSGQGDYTLLVRISQVVDGLSLGAPPPSLLLTFFITSFTSSSFFAFPSPFFPSTQVAAVASSWLHAGVVKTKPTSSPPAAVAVFTTQASASPKRSWSSSTPLI